MDESRSSIHFPLHYEPFRRAGLSFRRFRRALKAARLRRPLSICSPALPHLWSWHSASVCTWEGVDAELVRSVHSPSVCSHSVTTELCACARARACARVTEQVVGTTTPVLFFFNMRRERAYFYICGWEDEEHHCLHLFFYSLAPPNLHRLVPFYFFPAAGDVFALCVIDRTTLAARPVFLAKLEANSQGVIRRPCSCFLWSEKCINIWAEDAPEGLIVYSRALLDIQEFTDPKSLISFWLTVAAAEIQLFRQLEWYFWTAAEKVIKVGGFV